jgi:multiple sugar transport system ATP-binding protein
MAEIELEKVTKRFGDVTAVRDASFTIRDGELFILVGPSGCGKSTMLELIVGLQSVTEGEIRVDGERVNELDPKERDMAMVFQSYALYPHMTVRENIAFPLKLAKLAKREIVERVGWAADILELGELLDRKPAVLSGGQRQRVAMGRAIVRKPRVFLLDEPLSNLDAKLRLQMRTELLRLHRRLGTTTVYVTHDQVEAMTLGHRMAILRKGEVQQVGTPRQLYESPVNVFVGGFLGSPPMNFLPARCQGDQLVMPIGRTRLPSSLRRSSLPSEIVAGFRPEHVRAADRREEDELVFDAEVETAEWLGTETVVHATIPSTDFEPVPLPSDLGSRPGSAEQNALIARLEPDHVPHPGDRLSLRLSARSIHLFDARNGQRLTTSEPAVS